MLRRNVLGESRRRLPIVSFDIRDEQRQQCGKPAEELLLAPLNETDPRRMVQVNAHLDDIARARLVDFLRANIDIFI